MPQRDRRRTIIGIGVLAMGASGAVASGAVSFGSDGSLSDNFIQVTGVDQTATYSSLSQAGAVEDSDGDEEGSQGVGNPEQGAQEGEQTGAKNREGESADSDSSNNNEPPTTRVQVVVDPDNPGNAINQNGSAMWNGSIISSDAISETSDGFFNGFSAKNLNQKTRFTFGTLENQFPGEQVAFLIANVGPANDNDSTVSADVSSTLLADGEVIETDQLRLAYKVLDSGGNRITRGENLLSDTVPLAGGHVIEIVIIIDTRDGSDDLQQLDTIQFSTAASSQV